MRNKKEIQKKSIIVISILMIVFAILIIIVINNKKENSIIKIEPIAKKMMNENYMYLVEAKLKPDSEETIQVPVPKGYVGSKATGENIVNTGFVIYEGEEDVTDENVAEAQTTRNQYVWVPIENPNEIYGTDANGKRWGKTYEFSETGRTNWSWRETNGIIKAAAEPVAIIKTNADNNSKELINNLYGMTELEFTEQMERGFNEMLQSVITYGGFYIGRYETGDLLKQQWVVMKGNKDIVTPDWYEMYMKCKDIKAKNKNIETYMIWGCLWDATLEWIVSTGDKTYSEVAVDSTSWGNYINNEFNYVNSDGTVKTKNADTGMIIPTGSADKLKANNIYDLAGNVWERTMESRGSDRTWRGGNSGFNGAVKYASKRDGLYPGSKYPTAGCRAILYIK